MRKRRLITMLAVVAMMMGAMAPAWAATGGVSKASLEAKGWFCFDNSSAGGAGNHCTNKYDNMDDILAYLNGDGGTGNLHLMVFSPEDGDIFYGTELLGWKNGELFAEHHWKAGVDRA